MITVSRLYEGGKKAGLPKEVREKLGLQAGDKVKINILEPIEAQFIAKVDRIGRYGIPAHVRKYGRLQDVNYIKVDVQKARADEDIISSIEPNKPKAVIILLF